MSNKPAAIEFLQMAARGDVVAAYERHVAPAFTHHNPYFAHDRRSLMEGMLQSAADEPNKSFEVVRAVEEADMVAVHSRLTRSATGGQYAVVHLLKFEDGKIIEAWDIGQEVPAGSPNTLGMF